MLKSSFSFATRELRKDANTTQLFISHDATELPNVIINPYAGPEVVNRSLSRGHEIQVDDIGRIGTFTLVGKPSTRNYVRNIEIDPEYRGERFGVSTYIVP